METENRNYLNMRAGKPYRALDPIFGELKSLATARKAEVDAISESDMESRVKALSELLTLSDKAIVQGPFKVQFGKHVHLGEWVFINYDATFLDSNTITIGDFTAVGPNVQFITDTHPVRPQDRIIPKDDGSFPPFEVINIALPITIGTHCWIGAGAIILPGVEIGDNTVVGAGAVVTKSLPAGVIAVGNPARVIGKAEEATPYTLE